MPYAQGRVLVLFTKAIVVEVVIACLRLAVNNYIALCSSVPKYRSHQTTRHEKGSGQDHQHRDSELHYADILLPVCRDDTAGWPSDTHSRHSHDGTLFLQ